MEAQALNLVVVGEGTSAVDVPALGRVYQEGPVYRCWWCGEAATCLDYWPVHPDPRRACRLDEFAMHIAYLRLPCNHHNLPGRSGRVAVLGRYITPLEFLKGSDNYDERITFNCSAVADALVYLSEIASAAAVRSAREVYLDRLVRDLGAEVEAGEREARLLEESMIEGELR